MTDVPTDADDADVECDDRTGTYRFTVDRSADEPPSVSLVLAIAGIDGVEPPALAPSSSTSTPTP